MTTRLRLLVAYHGAAFRGVAPQPGVRTVGGRIVEAVSTVLREPTPVLFVCAGRTDAGVHAMGQVVHLDVAAPADAVDLEALVRRLNKMLRPSIVVRRAGFAPEGFDARRSARWRRYRYTVLNRPEPDPLAHGVVWHVPEPLDLDMMRLACDPFLGEHDFTSFGRVPKDNPAATMVRTVLSLDWDREHSAGPGGGPPDRLVCTIRATAFCQQMVRSIVAFHVEVGRGRRHPGEVLGVLAARQRSLAGGVAPPDGLVLWDVGYDPEHSWDL